MAKAECELKAKVPAEKYLAAVLDFKSYPEFVPGCDHVDVRALSETDWEVTYSVEIMGQKISYTLSHTVGPEPGMLGWQLKESAFLAHNQGRWTVRPLDEDSCQVHYAIEIEFKLPVPGFLLNRLIKSQLPALLKSFEEKAS